MRFPLVGIQITRRFRALLASALMALACFMALALTGRAIADDRGSDTPGTVAFPILLPRRRG